MHILVCRFYIQIVHLNGFYYFLFPLDNQERGIIHSQNKILARNSENTQVKTSHHNL